MTWTTLGTDELGVDRIATSPTALALYDNPIAIANGDAGAPSIQTAAIANDAVTFVKIDADAVRESSIQAAAVTQSRLATSTGSVNTIGPANLTLPGGQYGFYPQVKKDVSGDATAQIASAKSGTSYVTNIWLDSSDSDETFARQRYVTSSPPFDLGDGPVRGFAFVLLRGGAPVATYLAEVPPWAYNGPTDIRAHQVDKRGRKWRLVPRRARLVGRVLRGELPPEALREAEPQAEWQEITQALKNDDMPIVPHPFPDARPDDVVILLDPMDELVSVLLEAQDAGEDAGRLITSGRLEPDSEPLARKGPPGVMQAAIRYRPGPSARRRRS